MRTTALMWLALTMPLAGCASNPMNDLSPAVQNPAGKPHMDTLERVVDGNKLPLRFVKHSFSVHCYDTLAIYVEYNGDGSFCMTYRNKRSPAYKDSIPRERWGLADYIGVSNWPEPARVRWTSLDGVDYSTELDFAEIFPDGLTLHQVPDHELPAGMFSQGISSDPEIHLEVDNKTIRIYQRGWIPTRSEQIPGNRYSHRRRDLYLVAEYQY